MGVGGVWSDKKKRCEAVCVSVWRHRHGCVQQMHRGEQGQGCARSLLCIKVYHGRGGECVRYRDHAAKCVRALCVKRVILRRSLL